LLLRQAYDGSESFSEEQVTAIELLLDAAFPADDSRAVPWIKDYHLLFGCLSCPPERLAEWTGVFATNGMTFETHYAWFELCGAGLLNAGEVEAARGVLNFGLFPGNRFACTPRGLILQAWIVLCGGWTPNPRAHEMEIYSRFIESWQRGYQSQPASQNGHSQNGKNHDPAIPDDHIQLQQMKSLIDQVQAVATGRAAPAPTEWEHYGDSRMIAQLWSSDEAARQAAARALLARLEKGTLQPPSYRTPILQAICHWVLGNDDEFLRHYAALAPQIAEHPVTAAALWRRAASIWVKQQQWNQVLKNLPSCLADLEDPFVRILLGIAYSQAAVADAARSDMRSALAKVRQARTALEQLLEQ
jgi:hypothetical protein